MRHALSLVGALATAALAACGEATAVPTGTASIKIVNVAATAGTIVRRVNTDAAVTMTLNDTATATTTVNVPQGVQQIRIYRGPDTTGAVLVNTSLTVRAGERYVVVISGNIPTTGTPTLRSTVLQQQPFSLPTGTLSQTGVYAALPASAAAVRVVNASANANAAGSGTVNAYLYPASGTRPATATLASAAFPSASDYQYVDVTTAPYRLDITSVAATPVVRGTLNPLALAAGNIRTIVVVDGATASTVQFFVINDN